ncbi:protein timeless homolog isoform X2 [Orbicella faveolata]|uniref:protein timeless homolog isoform X2 n=1 Tax=Orbicella faveolata TaxID=48498 RepID=UPI0009E53A31|nr:protein timeless homolog isoform X2 [Orbicella faveolata]
MTSFCGARQIEATTLARFSGDVIFRSELRVVSSNVLIFFHDLRLGNLTLGAIFMPTWWSVACRRRVIEMENLNDLGEYLNTEIVCTLAGLGYSEGSDYYKSPDCLESLKDLVRFLRRDDTTCEIRRQLGYSEVLQNDLVAILKSCSSKEREIFDMVIRLMVNLTQPAVLCFGNNIPDDKTGQHYYLDIVTQLQSYKEAFTEKEVMSVIGRELGRLLQMEWDDRLEDDSLLIERILLLIRNILHVPANKQAEKVNSCRNRNKLWQDRLLF